jgi:hypothetical protein
VYLLHRFLSRIGFKGAVARQIQLVQRNNRYTTGEMLLALVYPMILVAGRRQAAWPRALRTIDHLRV